MKTATAFISLNFSAHVSIYMQPGETEDDLFALSGDDIFERIVDPADLLDCIDGNDLDVDDITIDKDPKPTDEQNKG